MFKRVETLLLSVENWAKILNWKEGGRRIMLVLLLVYLPFSFLMIATFVREAESEYRKAHQGIRLISPDMKSFWRLSPDFLPSLYVFENQPASCRKLSVDFKENLELRGIRHTKEHRSWRLDSMPYEVKNKLSGAWQEIGFDEAREIHAEHMLLWKSCLDAINVLIKERVIKNAHKSKNDQILLGVLLILSMFAAILFLPRLMVRLGKHLANSRHLYSVAKDDLKSFFRLVFSPLFLIVKVLLWLLEGFKKKD